MTEHQRLFLVQARSNFDVFEFVRREPRFPKCHALHYLQMATEMLGKAHAWKHGPPEKMTHRAFVNFLRSLATNRQAQEQLGFGLRNENWQHTIRKSVALARAVEDLAPALSPDTPNPEYPWPRFAPQSAPAEFEFPLWQDLEEKAAGRQFLSLVGRLFTVAETFV